MSSVRFVGVLTNDSISVFVPSNRPNSVYVTTPICDEVNPSSARYNMLRDMKSGSGIRLMFSSPVRSITNITSNFLGCFIPFQ